MAALAAVTGAEVRGAPVAPRDVTADLHEVPLVDAMPRLLGAQNFTLKYATDGRLTAIVLLGGPEAPVAPSATPTAAGVQEPSPSGTRGFPLVLESAFTKHKPVALSEPLAAKLGMQQATFPELLETATLDADGTTRAQASMVVLTALEREGRLRRSFLRSLHRLDDAGRAEILASESGPRFLEILELMAVHSREPGLQKKVSVVLDELTPPRDGS
jgi:hypothetical protein